MFHDEKGTRKLLQVHFKEQSSKPGQVILLGSFDDTELLCVQIKEMHSKTFI